MTVFVVIASVAALAVIAVTVWPLFGRRDAAARAERDAAVFRDQLAEIERDRERGTISDREAEGARAEISRRLIAATERAERAGRLAPAPRGLSGALAGFSLLAVPLVATVIYVVEGSPGQPDQPFAERRQEATRTADAGGQARPTQAEAEAATPRSGPQGEQSAERAEYEQMIARLERVLEDRPDDARGVRLLADGYMRLGRHADAWRAYERLIEIEGSDAPPDLYARQAEAMILAAGGYVSPSAEAVIGQALQRDPALPIARYYEGLRLAQAGRLDAAVAVWEKLRAESGPDAPWAGALDRMLARARGESPAAGGSAALDGPDGPPLPGDSAAPGPGRAEVEAARDMSPEDRQAMIEGMVQRLEDRLTSEGGSVEEWVRLMRARMQLGQREAARDVYDMGREALEGSEAGFLRERALVLGVIDG